MAHGKLVPLDWAMGAQLTGPPEPVQLAWASTVTSEELVMCGARRSAPLAALRVKVSPL